MKKQDLGKTDEGTGMQGNKIQEETRIFWSLVEQ